MHTGYLHIELTTVSTLDKLHAKHVLPGFTDRTAEEREIERQTSDITKVCRCTCSELELDIQDFRRCTTLIGSIQPGRQAPRVEVMTAKNVQRGLAQKVQDLSAQFRKKQRVYMQSESARHVGHLASPTGDIRCIQAHLV